MTDCCPGRIDRQPHFSGCPNRGKHGKHRPSKAKTATPKQREQVRASNARRLTPHPTIAEALHRLDAAVRADPSIGPGIAAKVDEIVGARSVAHLPKAKTFFIQDARGYHGNLVVWWGKDAKGYTSQLEDAWEVDEDEARSIERNRSTDKAWPAEQVRAAASLYVDIQQLRKSPHG